MKQIAAAEFETEVLRSNAPVAVDFYTGRCAQCVSLARVLEELAAELAGRWKFVKVNAEEAVDLSSAFRISAVPTLLAFREGRCVAQRVGGGTKRQVLAWLAEASQTGDE